MFEELYSQAADLIKSAGVVVALTGAGISTPSGIPDFRSPGSGIWEKVDPMEVATIDSFKRNPERFFSFIEPVARTMINAKPNPAHDTLARWEAQGKLRSVITQNIDNLHQKAGSKNVLELHGNASRAYCMKCLKGYSHEEMMDKLHAASVPYCDCDDMGLIKPDVILFGEQLPFKTLMQAERDARECDVMIVVGSSLTVSPASMLPQLAVQSGAYVIVLNMQETYIDKDAKVVIRGRLEEALPEIFSRMN